MNTTSMFITAAVFFIAAIFTMFLDFGDNKKMQEIADCATVTLTFMWLAFFTGGLYMLTY